MSGANRFYGLNFPFGFSHIFTQLRIWSANDIIGLRSCHAIFIKISFLALLSQESVRTVHLWTKNIKVFLLTFHFKLLRKSLGMILRLTNFIPVTLDRTACLTIDLPFSLTRTTYLLLPRVLIPQASKNFAKVRKLISSSI